MVHSSNTYFVTSAAWQRRAIFQTERMAGLFVESLMGYRKQGKFELHEFVLMPDHFHVLLTPRGITLERAVQFIKGGFSFRARQFVGSKEIWQVGFSDRRVRNGEEYVSMAEYVHMNSVRARLAERAEEYRWSSASGRFEVDPVPEYLRG